MTKLSDSKLPSEKSFGFLFTGVFVFLAIYGHFVKNWESPGVVICLGLSAAFCLMTLVMPRLLAPLNKAWFQIGELMGKLVSPIVLGVIFFLIITPVGLLGRLFGRDELRLKRRRQAASYWVERQPPGPTGDSFKNQF